MNLVIMLPVALIILVAVIIFYSRRSKAGGSGLGERPDATEPQELRGSNQWETRERSSGSSTSGATDKR